MYLQHTATRPEKSTKGRESNEEEEGEDEGQMFDVVKSFEPRCVE